MDLTCPTCAKQYELSADYIAEHGGNEFTCPCGTSLVVPGPVEPGDAPAPPVSPAEATVWADGIHVVVARGMRMPRRCWKCNVPVEATKQRTLKWTPRRPKFRELGSPAVSLAATLIADSYSRSAVIRVGKCPKHRFEISPFKVGMWMLAIAIPALISSCLLPFGWGEWVAPIALLLAIASFPVMRIPATTRIVSYKNGRAWISGFGDAYLDALPQYKEAVAAERKSVADAIDQVE